MRAIEFFKRNKSKPSANNCGFTLVELLVVVAIIGILAAIAIPSYMKYIRSARTTEATSNLAAIQSYEESYFSENDTYLSAGANPATLPISGTKQNFNGSMAGWTSLGRVIANARPLFFQYMITAGSVSAAAVVTPGTVTHAIAGGTCTVVGSTTAANFSDTYANLVGAATANTYFFVATAIGDQDGDGKCSLFVAVTDRPDITQEQPTE
jgi:prepilin-type N-terminal cleavage/methylation domain-containing protein